MSVLDKLNEKAEKKPQKQQQQEEDQLILGIIIPVKFYHGRYKTVKGYLNLHPDAIYSGRLDVAIEAVLEEAGGVLDLNVWEQDKQYNSYNQRDGGYSKNWRR